MTNKKTSTYESKVRNFYSDILNKRLYIAHDVASFSSDDLLTIVNSIDTSKFAVQCFMATGVKPTTSERYLRVFRAADRRLLGS